MTTTTTKWKTGGVLIPDSVGGQVYRRVKGEEGADPTTASEVLFTPSDAGYEPTLYANAGITLTLANRLAMNASVQPGAVIFRLPLFYTLGYTRTPGTTPDLVFSFERQGQGQIFLNPANYRGEVASQAAMVALSASVTGDWCQRTDQSGAGSRGGQVFVLTGAAFGTAGNWTALGMTLANRPNIAWGTVVDNAAMVALSNAIPGDFCVNTAGGSATYQLTALPASTLANWVTRTDADKPIDPQVKLYNLTALDPQFLAVGQSVQAKAIRYENDCYTLR